MPNGWHRTDIIAAVHKRGTSLAALARRHGKGDSTLRAALSKPSKPSNRIIAAFLGVAMHELWPEWFDDEGQQIAHVDRAKPAARPASQKRRAA